MDAATVTQLGSGEPTVMHGEADTVQAMKEGARGAAKTRIRTRIVHVGSEYRRDGTSVTCELCIAGWAVGALASPSNSRTSTLAPHGRPSPRPSPSAPGTTSGKSGSTSSRSPRPSHTSPSPSTRAATPPRTTKPRPRADEAGAQDWRGRGSVTRIGRRRGSGGAARGRYSQATPSLSRSRRGL